MQLRHLVSVFLFALSTAAISISHAADLKVGVGADITSMDPHFVNLFPNNGVAEHIDNKLVTLILIPD